MRDARLGAAVALLAAALAAGLACGGPAMTTYAPGPSAVPVARLDYAAWDALLRANVRAGEVDYSGFARADAFHGFLAALRNSRMVVPTVRDARLALWLNAYNAFVVAGIVRGGAILEEDARDDFFQELTWEVAGEQMTLRDLEERRLRPFADPRTHFALANGAVSGPALAAEAFVPERVEAQLDACTRAFVNDPSRNLFDRAARVAYLSPIFLWYQADFLAVAPSLLAFVAPHLEDRALAAELDSGAWSVRFRPYDWSLNGRPPAPPALE